MVVLATSVSCMRHVDYKGLMEELCLAKHKMNQRGRRMLVWDLKDLNGYVHNAVTVEPFNMWPSGNCGHVYSATSLQAKRHLSGWAMRNTNNHNINILKKSCLGVLVCSNSCRRQNGSVVAVRPAICDKARRKQMGRKCPNGCGGKLVMQACKGHNGYPVTHFWRHFEDKVFFIGKGYHDHPKPEVKLSSEKRRAYTKNPNKLYRRSQKSLSTAAADANITVKAPASLSNRQLDVSFNLMNNVAPYYGLSNMYPPSTDNCYVPGTSSDLLNPSSSLLSQYKYYSQQYQQLPSNNYQALQSYQSSCQFSKSDTNNYTHFRSTYPALSDQSSILTNNQYYWQNYPSTSTNSSLLYNNPTSYLDRYDACGLSELSSSLQPYTNSPMSPVDYSSPRAYPLSIASFTNKDDDETGTILDLTTATHQAIPNWPYEDLGGNKTYAEPSNMAFYQPSKDSIQQQDDLTANLTQTVKEKVAAMASARLSTSLPALTATIQSASENSTKTLESGSSEQAQSAPKKYWDQTATSTAYSYKSDMDDLMAIDDIDMSDINNIVNMPTLQNPARKHTQAAEEAEEAITSKPALPSLSSFLQGLEYL